ncbi:MAG: TIGR00725 family protein, partial [Calditrichia bacterium]
MKDSRKPMPLETPANSNNTLPLIAVVGGNTCSNEVYETAREIGKRIAGAGAVLICGGLGGVMEAACKGAQDAGGLTIGILPGEIAGEANPYVTIAVPTGMGVGRNIIIVRSAAAVIAVDGKYGTLSEIAYALQLGKKVIAVQPWVAVPGIETVQTPKEAVESAVSVIQKKG